MLSSWAPLSLSRSLSLYLYLPFPSRCVLYSLLLHPYLALSLPTRLALSILWVLQPSACVGSLVLLSQKLPLSLRIVAPMRGFPPPIFKSPVGTLAVQMPKRLCPLVLRPQRASADRLVGDKSNSVTRVAGVMLSGWQRASPFEQMPALPLCPLPKTQYHQQSSAEGRRRRLRRRGRRRKDGTDLIERNRTV